MWALSFFFPIFFSLDNFTFLTFLLRNSGDSNSNSKSAKTPGPNNKGETAATYLAAYHEEAALKGKIQFLILLD